MKIAINENSKNILCRLCYLCNEYLKLEFAPRTASFISPVQLQAAGRERATLEPSIRGLVSDFQTSEGSAAAVLPPALACLPQLSSPTSAAFQELSIFSDFYL